MLGKFHDDQYEGLVLKIPSWFIKMNNLESQIEALKIALENCDKSMYYKDHLNNLYELDLYKNKEGIFEEKIAAKKALEEKLKNKDADLLNGNIYELVWIDRKFGLDLSYVRLGDKSWSTEDYETKQLNIKASFKNEIEALLKTHEDWKEFALLNCAMLYEDLKMCPKELIMLSPNFYNSRYGNLSISWKRLSVRVYEKGKRNNKLYFRTHPLVLDENGIYAIWAGGNIEARRTLDGFTRKGMELIKAKDNQS